MEKTSIYYKDYLVSRLISFGKSVDGYNELYYKTNEDLVSMYESIDFKDKDVLSVLASSDQVFTSRLLGAKSVDSFDMNRLTIYYYYLRKWSIKYMGELYPNIFDNSWMKKLLSMVKPESKMEKIAKEFFMLHLNDDTIFERMFYDMERQPEGKTIYSSALELSSVVDMPLEFYSLNLFNGFGNNKKYDIVIISNILEWARGDKDKLLHARNLLSSLLKSNGKILCSDLIGNDDSNEREAFINFDREVYSDTNYSYTKKLI